MRREEKRGGPILEKDQFGGRVFEGSFTESKVKTVHLSNLLL